jgi:hypothetical protein
MAAIQTPVKPCVVPVAAADALAWAQGRLHDNDLLLRAPLVPEAVFLVSLPDRASYREMLRQVLYWRQRGAVCLIARTANVAVDDHLAVKNGCLATFREDRTHYRFFAPPAAFHRWIGRFTARNAAGSVACRRPVPGPALTPAG